MSPGNVLKFCSRQLDVDVVKFLVKNAGEIAKLAIEKGWTKAKNIKDAVKNFSAKTKEDDTGIDWDNVEIDEDTVRLHCLFDGESGEKLKKFCRKLEEKLKAFAEEKLNEASKKKSKLIAAVAGDTAADVADAASDSGAIDTAIETVKKKLDVNGIIDKVKEKLGVGAAETAKEMANDEDLKDGVA